MKLNKLYLFAALLGVMLAGCQTIEEQKPGDEPDVIQKGWTLTVKASLGAETRALELVPTTGTKNKLNAYWKEDEMVAVYCGENWLGTLSVISVAANGVATLSGTLNSVEGVNEQGNLSLLFLGEDADPTVEPTWSYLGQTIVLPGDAGTGLSENGKALPLGSAYDYATASLTVNTVNTETQVITATDDEIEFENEQCVYGFKFNIAVKSFTLSSSQNQLVRTRTKTANGWSSDGGYGSLTLAIPPTATPIVAETPIYMSIRNENTSQNDTYSFSIVGNDDKLYMASKNISSAAFANGQGQFFSATINASAKSFAPEETGEIATEAEVL